MVLAARLGVVWWLALVGNQLLPLPVAGGNELYVDPTVAGPTAEDGSPDAPFRTLGSALAAVNPGEDTTLRLAAGSYSIRSGEEFPLRLTLGASRLVLEGPARGEARLEGLLGEETILEIEGGSLGELPTRIELRNLLVHGGQDGVALLGKEAATLEVLVTGCRFESQKTHGLELVAGAFGTARVTVERCIFEGTALYPLDLATARNAHLEFEVVECRLEGRPFAPGTSGVEALNHGVSVFLDEAADVQGTLRRNLLSDTGNGLLVSTAETWRLPGRLELDVIGNAIVASPGPERGLRHGAVLSIFPHHVIRMRWVHNTIVGGSGRGLEVPTIDALRGSVDLAARLAVEATGNVVQGFGAGASGLETEDGESIPGVTWRGNALESSRVIGVDGNIPVDAADLVWASRGYLPAPGSSLIDAAGPLPPELSEAVDLDGACRVADGDDDGVLAADLGAHERAGPCLADARRFVRGNCAGSDRVDITDAIHVIDYLFLGNAAVNCRDACDADDSGYLDITDGINVLSHIFLGADPPPSPYPAPGLDPTGDRLGLCLDTAGV